MLLSGYVNIFIAFRFISNVFICLKCPLNPVSLVTERNQQISHLSVCGLVTSWNYPLMMFSWKMAVVIRLVVTHRDYPLLFVFRCLWTGNAVELPAHDVVLEMAVVIGGLPITIRVEACVGW